MTQAEIEQILQRLAVIEERIRLLEVQCADFYQVKRLVYVVLGVALGSGFLQLSQVVA